MTLNHANSLRFTAYHIYGRLLRRKAIALCRRTYAKSVNPYTSTIALPKTDYELWPKHDTIQARFLTKVTDDCYKWQVAESLPAAHIRLKI
jgi:hypothetical protein